MRTLLLAVAWLGAACFTAVAQNPAYTYPEADPNGERFLFIVDMSSDMEDLQPAVESAIYELIGGGIFGNMRAGDTFGVWTFNEVAYTGRFSMKVWDQKRAIQQGTVAAAFVSGQNYEKSSNLKDVVKQLKTVIHSVSNLNVLIISDGRSSISGTPLDKAINADYKARKSDRRRAKKPFITSLVAREGWIVSHQVVIAGEPIRFPERRPPPAPVRPAAAEVRPVAAPPSIFVTNTPAPKRMVIMTKTNAPAPTAAAPPATPETNMIVVTSPPTPAPAIAPAVVVAPTNVPVKDAAVPAAAVVVASQANILAASREAGAPANKPIPPATPAATSKPPEPAPSVNTTAPQVAATPVPSSVIESVLAKVQPEPVRAAARERTAEPEAAASGPTPALALGVPGAQPSFGNWWMAFGGFLAGTTLLLAFTVLRRGRAPAGPSMITRSMDRR